ncbi:MAG: site-specific DNA-methyltransferase [Coriobacteriia bacterium]|nr:site-specific DNA-methyltransferase [Coriobacteriia bacterium]
MPSLEWIGKEKVINHHLDVPFRILDHQYHYGQENSGNKIIHGDNLEALKALLPEYEGRIDCIYIDPPYNTGNEGWVYNDSVNDPKMMNWLGKVVGSEGEDLTRHDKWLCMMYPRLKLLQRLLSNEGSIFISIGDDEIASLKLICNEVFGSNNFVDTVVWQKIYTIKNSAQYFSGMHDYILVYAKNKASFKRNLLPRTDDLDATYTNPDNDPRGPWTTNAVQARNFNGQGTYEIVSPNGKVFLPPTGTYWRTSLATFQELDKDNRIWWGKNGNSVPRIKKFLSEAKQGVVPTTLWLHSEAGQNADAKIEVRSVLQDTSGTFDTPKPTRLIERVLQIASDSEALILDSFAGSGTTAHAVLNMNKSDGGNRRFILVEMEDYAETITAERVRRVISGYGETEGTGSGFDYYELGDTLLIDNQLLNTDVPKDIIRSYVWYMETHQPKPQSLISHTDNTYFLGEHDGTAYYFIYEKEAVTTLDTSFLSTISTKSDNYIVYADQCTINDNDLRRYGITFKKIPRDIKKL